MSHYRLKPIVTLCHVTHNIMRPESFRRCQDWITDSHGPYVSMHVLHKWQYIRTKHYLSRHYSSIKIHHQLQLAYSHLAIDTVHVRQVLNPIRV